LCIAENKRENLNSMLLKNLKNLTLDSNGICVIKKLINTNQSETIKKRILEEIQYNCLEIVQSPFGNYAIQHVLEEWGMEISKNIILIIKENIVSLSMQKFSSNVVEKCLEMSDNVSFYSKK
jgi:hypothetical protein